MVNDKWRMHYCATMKIEFITINEKYIQQNENEARNLGDDNISKGKRMNKIEQIFLVKRYCTFRDLIPPRMKTKFWIHACSLF